MKLSIGQTTDPGPREGENQDSILTARVNSNPEKVLLVVSDGMGGANAGEQASREAVSVIHDRIFTGDPLTEDTVPARLEQAISEANLAIYRRAGNNPELEGMGCTVVVVVAIDDLFWVASVGDSRVYLIRDKTITQLTTDHTWVNARVREGLITPEQAINHSLSHVLDRALGVDQQVEIDVWPDDYLEEGDVLVLCSDGLYGVLDNSTIAWIAANYPAEEAAEKLMAKALSAPAHDNVSVVVLRAGEFDPGSTWESEEFRRE